LQHPDFPIRETRVPWPVIWLDLAESIAVGRSSCQRAQVGCVITPADSTRVLAIGYNGTYRGGPNECLGDPSVPGGCECIHAEDNALVKLDYTEPSKVAYITTMPCLKCAQLLINAGIDMVYYSSNYRASAGIDLLQKVGIPVHAVDRDMVEFVGIPTEIRNEESLDDGEDDDEDDDDDWDGSYTNV